MSLFLEFEIYNLSKELEKIGFKLEIEPVVPNSTNDEVYYKVTFLNLNNEQDILKFSNVSEHELWVFSQGIRTGLHIAEKGKK